MITETIYTAQSNCNIRLESRNVAETKCVIRVNGEIADDVVLCQGTTQHPNLRVLELELEPMDLVTADVESPGIVTFSVMS